MSFGNLHLRPDLSPIFGAMAPGENDRLLDRLDRIDRRLNQLAVDASGHVGVPYEPVPLGLFFGSNTAEISGGPSGEAADIWFELGFSKDAGSGRWFAPPWTVESRLVVFCSDAPEPRGYSSCHDLVRLVGQGFSPDEALDILEEHIAALAAEVSRRPAATFTETRHADMPAG
jgi:hypothetical protein